MIERILKLTNRIVKAALMILLTGFVILLIYFALIIFWPYIYMCKIYDLDDKYISCEWVNFSDSIRVVITTKDGHHRAVFLDTYENLRMTSNLILPKCGLDTIYFEGRDGSAYECAKVVECSNMTFSYSTGHSLKYDPNANGGVGTDYGGFDHLFNNNKLKDGYVSVFLQRGDDHDPLAYPKPKKVTWIWPLKSPLLKKYPFSEHAHKSWYNCTLPS